MAEPPRGRSGRAPLRVGLVLAVAALLALAPTAVAATANPLASGQTTLLLKRGFLRELAGKGVRLSASGTAGQSEGRALSLPVVGGALDPVDGSGLIEHVGTLRLSHRGHGVAIAGIDAETASGIVRARVAGATMKLGFLAARTSERAGFGVNVRSTALRLSGVAARRLSRKLGLDRAAWLTPGRALSNLYSQTQPRTVAILPSPASSYHAPLGGDPSIDPALSKMFARDALPFGIAPALTHYPMSPQWPPLDVIVFFPIDAGSVAPDGSEATVALGGGIEIRMPANGVAVARTGITLDLGRRVLASPEGPILSLESAGADVWTDPAERKIYIGGIGATLSAPFAAQLNSAFDPFLPAPLPATEFRQGDAIGSINLLLEAR